MGQKIEQSEIFLFCFLKVEKVRVRAWTFGYTSFTPTHILAIVRHLSALNNKSKEYGIRWHSDTWHIKCIGIRIKVNLIRNATSSRQQVTNILMFSISYAVCNFPDIPITYSVNVEEWKIHSFMGNMEDHFISDWKSLSQFP